ncbi:MAG: PAS domain S-box protein, partial [Bacteroidales bacterium]|nr:PAS domain S-box protein [Bacteroidales bacterium]
MKDTSKTKKELLSELTSLRKELNELKKVSDKEITDLIKRNKYQVHAEKEIFRKISKHTRDIYFELDLAGTILYISPQVENLFGAPFDELIGKSITSIFDIEKIRVVKSMETLKEKEQVENEAMVTTKSGISRWVHFYIRYFLAEDNEARLVGILYDVTEKKHAQQKMQKSDSLYQSILKASPDTVVITDLNWKILFASSRAYSMFGHGPDFNFTDHTIFEFLDEKDHSRAIESITKMIQGKQYGIRHYNGIRADGSLFNMEINSVMIRDDNNKPVNLLLVIRDVSDRFTLETELAKKEAIFQSAMKASPDMITLTDFEGRIIYTSNITRKLFGYDDEFVFEGKSLIEFVVKEDREKVLKSIEDIFSGHISSGVFTALRADGTTFPIEANRNFVLDEQNNLMSLIFVSRDISERVKIAQELRETEERYRTIVETINDVIFEIDAMGNILYISPSVTKISGYIPEELIGKNFINYVLEEDKKHVYQIFGEGKEDSDRIMEYRFVSKNKKIIWVRINSKATYQEGKVVSRIGVIYEVTKQKQAEMALRESEKNYKMAQEIAKMGHWELDFATQRIRWSDETYTLFNIKPGEFDGSFKSFLETVHPEDREMVEKKFLESIQKGSAYDVVHRTVLQNGQIKYINERCRTERDKNGKPVRSIGVALDITEREIFKKSLQETQHQLSTIYHTVGDMIFYVRVEKNETYRFVTVNDMFCKILGLSMDQVIGKTLDEIAQEPSLSLTKKNYKKAIKEKKRVRWESTTSYPTGRLTLDVSIAPVFDEKGKCTFLVGSGHDMTAQKEKQEEITRQKEELRAYFEHDISADFLVTSNGDLISSNKTFDVMFGVRTAAQKKKFNIRKLYKNPSEREILLEKISQNGKVENYEIDLIDLNGKPISVLANIIGEFDDDAKLVSLREYVVDITQRKQAEAMLLKLYRAVEQSPVSIVITDLDGKIQYANPMASESTGYTLDELMGQNPSVLKSGDTPDEQYQQLWEDITEGKVWKGIFHNKKKNGELYWESAQIAPVMDQEGDVISYIAVKEDISKRKMIQEALTLSEDRFRQVAEQSRTVVWEVDSEGLYTYVSSVAEKVWGYSPAELIGKKHYYDLHPMESRSAFIRSTQAYFAKKMKFENLLNPVIHKNGTTIWNMTNGVPMINEKGEVIGYRGSDFDVTDQIKAEKLLRNSEEALNQAQEIATMGSWEYDYAHEKVIWSNNMYRMLGLKPGEIPIDRDSINQYIHEEDIEGHRNHIQEIFQKGRGGENDFRIVLKDGSVRWLHNVIAPFYKNKKLVKLHGIAIDITEKKIRENELIETNNRLSAIMNAIPDLVFVYDKEGVCKEYYSVKEKKTAIPEEAIIGSSLKDIYRHDAEKAAQHLKTIHEAIATGKLITYEYDLDIDGEKNYFEGRFKALDEEHVLIFARDITESRWADMEIRKLSQAVNQLPMSVVITNLEGTIEYCNTFLSTSTGYSEEEILGRSPRLFKSGKMPKSFYTTLWNRINQGKSWHGEIINRKKDGTLYWEDMTITPVYNHQGVMTNFMALKQDISERKETEVSLNLFRNLIDSVDDSIEIVDLKTRKFVDFNRQSYEKLGYTREEFANLKINDIDPMVNAELIDELSDDLLLNKGILFNGVHKRKDGSTFPVEVNIRLVRLDKKYIIGIARDVTERKEAEEKIKELNSSLEQKVIERTQQLENVNVALKAEVEERKQAEDEIRKARLEAEEANKAKSEFLSRMSHELRTPMNSILGFAQLLEMGQLNQRQTKGVHHIMKSGKHLLNLINEVLDISRIEAGRISLSMEPVLVYDAVAEMLEVIKQPAEKKQLSI